jgi:hypothetical protein
VVQPYTADVVTVIRRALAVFCLAVFLFTALTTDLPALIVVNVEPGVRIASEAVSSTREAARPAVSLLVLALLRAPPLPFSLS